MPPHPTVAVVDIGSNSIKVLVAARGPGGIADAVLTQTLDVRISAGIGATRPRLTEDGMARGAAAVRELLDAAAALAPQRSALVATSAVRDAANGGEFRARLRASTGIEPRVLTGAEEAALIGRGLLQDPGLRELRDFYVIDLGGGSLECLAFADRRLDQAVSVPLGCVRLTESCVPDPSGPFSESSRARVAAICREVIAKSGFRFSLPAGAAAVFAGGSITTVRAIQAARIGRPISETSADISRIALEDLLAECARLPLADRRRIDGLPPARADVFPTALATAVAVADAGGFTGFRHSFYNLRYGVAAELLEEIGPG